MMARAMSVKDVKESYIKPRLKELSLRLTNYETHRDSMQKYEDTSYYDRLITKGRARIEELRRLKKELETW